MSKANNPPEAPMTPAHMAAQGIKQAQVTPSTVQESFNQIARYLQRPVAKGLYYNGKTITLDGFQFIECRFDNCKLIVNGTNFEIVKCVIDVSTSIQFGRDPTKVIRLYNTENEPLLGPDPEFHAIKNPDGSVTVHGEFYG